MNNEQLLLNKWRTLTPPKQQEVLDFIDSISRKFSQTEWQYLEKRPHSWRKQPYLKGRRLKAFDLWANMMANEMIPNPIVKTPLSFSLTFVETLQATSLQS